MRAKSLPVYSLDDEKLDATFSEGSVERKISYFNLPLMIKYKFNNNIYLKAGIQLGLLSSAVDIFSQNYNGDDVEYKKKIETKLTL